MRLLEREGIPPQIRRAILASWAEYSDGVGAHLKGRDFDYAYSVTTLARSPRQHLLAKRHRSEIVIDPADCWFLLLGSIVHYIMEHHSGPNDMVEPRFGRTIKIGGKKVYAHGAADLVTKLPDGKYAIEDYKFVSMNSMAYPKDDYIQQLNFLRILAPKEIRNNTVKLVNHFMFRDWRKSDSDKEPLYIRSISQPIWTDEQALNLLISRAKLLMKYEDTPDDELPYCSSEELWKRDSYGIRRNKNNGEPYKYLSGYGRTEYEAHKVATEKGLTDYSLEMVPGRAIRCQFCDSAPFCNQYKTQENDNSQGS